MPKSSHQPAQHDYGKPVATMSNYLDALAKANYIAPIIEPRPLLILAALRERMLGLARDQADGAHPYFVTPEHTARAREILGPDKLLAPEQKVLLVKDSDHRPAARPPVHETLSRLAKLP